MLVANQQLQYPGTVFVPVPATGAMGINMTATQSMPYPPYQMFSPPIATPDGMPVPVSYIPQVVPMNFSS